MVTLNPVGLPNPFPSGHVNGRRTIWGLEALTLAERNTHTYAEHAARAGVPILKLNIFIYSLHIDSCGEDNLPWSVKSQMFQVLSGLQSVHKLARWIDVVEQILRCLPHLLLQPRLVQPPGTSVTVEMSPSHQATVLTPCRIAPFLQHS